MTEEQLDSLLKCPQCGLIDGGIDRKWLNAKNPDQTHQSNYYEMMGRDGFTCCRCPECLKVWQLKYIR